MENEKRSEIVETIIAEITARLSEMTPREISEKTIQLSVELGNIGSMLVDAEVVYAKRWNELRLQLDTDGMADKVSKTTIEYKLKKELEYKFRTVKEIIQSLKKRISVLCEESRGNF
jgi:hypothetical protein